MTSSIKDLVVICPVYNEEATVPLFFERLQKIRVALHGRYNLLLVFVDNCSADKTPQRVREITAEHSWVAHLRMSRNNGYQRSLECGLRSARADYYTMIDVDCEDPPEMILTFLAEVEKGFDVVYGERVDRVEPVFIKWMRKQYYKVTRFASDEPFNLFMAEFCLINRHVRDALIQDNNSFPFFRASIARVGFLQKGIPYKRHTRIAGETHYNFFGMFAFGLAGILSSSTLLLRLTAYAMIPWLLLLTALFAAGLASNDSRYFWAGVWLGFVYFGLALAGIAIYTARTYKNALFRPNYFVDHNRSTLRPFLTTGSNGGAYMTEPSGGAHETESNDGPVRVEL